MAVSSAMASLMLANGRSTRLQLDESADPLTAGPRVGCGEADVEGWPSSDSEISGACFSCSSLFAARSIVYCLHDNLPDGGRGWRSKRPTGNERDLHAACPDETGPA